MSKRMKKLYALALLGVMCIQPIYAQSVISSGENNVTQPVKVIERAPQVSETLTFEVTKDAFVRDGSNENTNYGANVGLEVKQSIGGSTGYNRKFYVGFDLQGYTNQYIKSATVRLYLDEVIGNTEAEINKRPVDTVSLYAIDPNWDENTVTWKTGPQKGEKVTEFQVNRRQNSTYIDVDVTEYINQKLSKGEALNTISFSVEIDKDKAHDNGGERFASKESGKPVSQLVIETGLPAPTLSVTGLTDGMKVMDEKIRVQVDAASIDPSVQVGVEVTVNDQIVVGKNGSYDIPLAVGTNSIKVRATDEAGNIVEETYRVIKVEVQERTYYVDSIGGDDANDGLTPKTAWKSLDKLNEMEFMPGNKILLKRGGVWTGQFKPQGSGIKGYPIVIDTYGEGAKPIINGNGISSKDTNSKFPEGAVQLEGVSYYEISNLEVTNNGPEGDNTTYRGGIVSLALGAGDIEHIYIKDCYVHNVNSSCESSRNNKMSGGILILGDTRDKQGNNTGIKTTYNDVIVEDCQVKDVAIEGIRTKTWENGKDAPDRRNSNVIFRNNYIEGVHGDGIVISEIDTNGLVEKNIINDHSQCQTNLNYAGCWTWDSNDTIFQYNEVYGGTGGFMDGEAFDIDINCANVTYQYNYSHDNIGGFALFMNGLRENNVFRYNVSKNDGHGNEIFHYLPNSAGEAPEIYNNTIYIGAGIDVNYLFHQTVNGRPYPWAHFYNNIVQVDGNLKNFAGDRNGNTSQVARGTYQNNLIYPEQFANLPGSPTSHPGLITADPKLVNPTGTDEVMKTWTQAIWDRNLSKFQIAQDSPAINAGVSVANNGGRDLYGNPLYSGGQADIGAHEVIAQTTNPQVTMSSTMEVVAGQPFEIAVGIDHVTDAVYAQDIMLNYDSARFTFDGAEGVGDTEVIATKVENGKVRLLVAVPGGATSGNQVITLRFTPARSDRETVSTIMLTDITFGTVANSSSQVVEAEGAAVAVTVKPAAQGVDKTVLNNTITEAQNLSDNAVVGSEIGQYPQAAKDTLNAAILVARGVEQTSSDQVEIDAATATLREAINTFKAAIIKPVQEDINADGVVDVADLALVAFYYQVNEKSPNWNEAKKADINGDKKVDILDLGLVAQRILK